LARSIGSFVALVAGLLKAYRGVHEVITTIMLNSIVIALADYLASTPFKEPDQPITRTPKIEESARIPDLFGLPFGFFIAIAISVAFWWLMRRTTTGFRIETIGSEPQCRLVRRNICQASHHLKYVAWWCDRRNRGRSRDA